MSETRNKTVKRALTISDGVSVQYSIIAHNFTKGVSYSIEVSADDGLDSDSELLSNISSNTDEILRIFNAFVEECVMPCTAKYALSNLQEGEPIRLIK